MRKVIFLILIIAVAVLFLVPESVIGEYKGLISLKYFLKDSAIKARNIISALVRGERPGEFDVLEEKVKEKFEQGKEGAKEQLKDTLKESASDAIDEL